MALDLTANGRLNVDPRVSERRVEHIAHMVEATRLGGISGERARTDLRETLTTSDAAFSFSHLVNLRNLPEYDEAPRQWNLIADTESVPDFKPATFYRFETDFSNLEHGKDNDGRQIAPKVAEGDTYQYAFGYTQENAQLAVEKRGFKTGFTLEQAVNDLSRLVRRFPTDMLTVGLDTDEYVVFRALVRGVTAASKIQAGTDYVTGAAVPVDSALTPEALRVAIRQIGGRTDAKGRKVTIPSRLYVVVAPGEAESAQYAIDLAKGLVSIDDSGRIYRAPNQGGLGRIAGVIESDLVEGAAWYLVPAAGTTRIPTVQRVTLDGYSAPEVYVSNFNGAPLLGGASADPFTAFSFDNDTVDLKMRMFVNAALFNEDTIVWSEGDGV